MIPDIVTRQGKKYSWRTDLSVEKTNEFFAEETFLEKDSNLENYHKVRNYHVEISENGITEVEVVYQGENLPNDEVLENWKEQTSEYDQEIRAQEDNLAPHIF